VVRDGHHPDWKAEDESGPVPLQRGAGRYRGIPTPGGERQLTMRYRPRWRTPALLLSALGALAGLALVLWRPGCALFHHAVGTRRAILGFRVGK